MDTSVEKMAKLRPAFKKDGTVTAGCDMYKTNPMGRGISIGHPIACSDARIIVTLMGEMLRKEHDLGLASLCIGGGQGMATILEKV